ncbi:MAG: hypothetical protein JNM80_13475 [Phycisphaerae bacterium]|nr:hypothetical protein [Phycisphaerae bacterium]
MRSLIAATCAGVILASGCASKNEGSVDHRVLSQGRTPCPTACPESLASASKFIDEPTKGSEILKDGSITITLETAFIASFQELARPLLRGDAEPRGEIAIVVNVKELDGNGISFAPTAAATGRVVYYNEDVRPRERVSGSKSGTEPGQYLSIGGGLPVYGPVTWKGAPLLIEIHVIELDEDEASRSRELLKTLAGLGARAYPPASPALGVLESLGTALLQGPQNDTELSYHVVLHPFQVADSRSHSYLRAGDLVAVKRDHIRSGLVSNGPGLGPIPWDDLRLDRSTKRLRLKGSGDTLADYRNHTYVVLNIRTGEDARYNDSQNELYTLTALQGSILADSQRTTGTRASDVAAALARVERIAEFQSDLSDLRNIKSKVPLTGIDSLLRPMLERLKRDLDSQAKDQIYTAQQRETFVRTLHEAIRQVAPSSSATEVDSAIRGLTLDSIKNETVDDLLSKIKAALAPASAPPK